jgi:hypothetical protein
MREIIILLLLLQQIVVLKAQTVLAGTVKNHKGAAVAGASITLKDTYDGATTDSAGTFRFATTETGDQLLLVSAYGYKSVEQKVTLAGVPLSFSFSIKEEISEMKAVVITAGSFEASDKKRATVLNSIDIVTTASANADVTGAIKTLPGAQQVGESEGYLYAVARQPKPKPLLMVRWSIISSTAVCPMWHNAAAFRRLFLKERCLVLAATRPCMARLCHRRLFSNPSICPTVAQRILLYRLSTLVVVCKSYQKTTVHPGEPIMATPT